MLETDFNQGTVVVPRLSEPSIVQIPKQEDWLQKEKSIIFNAIICQNCVLEAQMQMCINVCMF